MTNEAPLIIIIDHEENLCWVVQRILEREGYRVMVAKDGTKALELIGEHQPDMVLLDFMLPDMSGQELCRRIREISACRIVYFSSIADLKLAGQIDKNADGFINKPASMKRIVSVVSNALK
jgi:CheY-like chemotaxis protein